MLLDFWRAPSDVPVEQLLLVLYSTEHMEIDGNADPSRVSYLGVGVSF